MRKFVYLAIFASLIMATGASAATLSFSPTAELVAPDSPGTIEVDVLMSATVGDDVNGASFRLEQMSGGAGLTVSAGASTLCDATVPTVSSQALNDVNLSDLGGTGDFFQVFSGTDLVARTLEIAYPAMAANTSSVIQLVFGTSTGDSPTYGDNGFMTHDFSNTSTLTITATPEPASALLLLLGGVFAMRRRNA